MEFSDSFRYTMENFLRTSSFSRNYMNNQHEIAPVMFKFKYNSPEIPVCLYFNSTSNRLDAEITAFLPIIEDRAPRGAETLLKKFGRQRPDILLKYKLANGEIYYGNSGVIFDRGFNPLLLATCIQEEGIGYENLKKIIHINPKVFTEENSLNKTLARKGIAFYLEWFSGRNGQVVIDDCSEFLYKIQNPHIEDIENNFKNVLKDNIDEILKQIAYDFPV